MKAKTIGAIILVAILLTVFVGCGGAATQPTTSAPAVPASEAVPVASAPAAPPEVSAPAAQPAQAESAPSVPVVPTVNGVPFSRATSFSEGLAWVQYGSTSADTKTSVINTNGEIVRRFDVKLENLSLFQDGHSFFDLGIIDANGDFTYEIANDQNRKILGYGAGHYVVSEHIANFDTNAYYLGAIDSRGNVLVGFIEVDEEITQARYLGESMFLMHTSFLDGTDNYLFNADKQSIVPIRPYVDDIGSFVNGNTVADRTIGFRRYFYKIDTLGNETQIAERDIIIDRGEVWLCPSGTELTGFMQAGVADLTCNYTPFSEGLFFHVNQYYDSEMNAVLSFPEYDGKSMLGGKFIDGFAPIAVRGADEKIYFTVIDKTGLKQFDLIEGIPQYEIGGGYLLVYSQESFVVYDISGEKHSEMPRKLTGHDSDYPLSIIENKVQNGYYIFTSNYQGGQGDSFYVGVDGNRVGIGAALAPGVETNSGTSTLDGAAASKTAWLVNANNSGYEIVFSPEYNTDPSESEMGQVIALLHQQINSMGLTEKAVIYYYYSQQGRIIMELFGFSDAAAATNTITELQKAVEQQVPFSLVTEGLKFFDMRTVDKEQELVDNHFIKLETNREVTIEMLQEVTAIVERVAGKSPALVGRYCDISVSAAPSIAGVITERLPSQQLVDILDGVKAVWGNDVTTLSAAIINMQ